jgi:hypothetical protein
MHIAFRISLSPKACIALTMLAAALCIGMLS